MSTAEVPPAPAPPVEPFVARLVRSRQWARMSQVDVAEALHVHPRTISAWERGENMPGVDKLVQWAQVTGFEPAWFLDGVTFDAGVTAGITQRSLPSPNGRGQPPLRRADVSHRTRSRRPFGPRVCAASPGAIHR